MDSYDKYSVFYIWDNPIVDFSCFTDTNHFYTVSIKKHEDQKFKKINEAFSYAHNFESDFTLRYFGFVSSIKRWLIFRCEKYRLNQSSQLSLFN